MRKVVHVIVLIALLTALQALPASAATYQTTLKIKNIFSGTAPRFITTDGNVWVYNSLIIQQVQGLRNIVSLSYGDGLYGTYALKSDGTVWKFDETFTSHQTPRIKDAVAIAQHYQTVYALDKYGRVIAGGDGIGYNNKVLQTKVKALSANEEKLLVLYTDGTVGELTFSGYKWGKITGLKSIISIYAGISSYFALDKNGNAWAWGRNDDGNLGDGTTIDRKTPVQVKGLPPISAINDRRALAKDGTVWTWGSNDWGQLGDGTPATPSVWEKTSNSVQELNPWYFPYKQASRTPHPVPVQVKGLTGIKQISNNYALDGKSVLWGWGDNRTRDLIDSAQTAITEPVRVQLTVTSTPAGKWTYTINKAYSLSKFQIPLSDGRVMDYGYEGSYIVNLSTGAFSHRLQLKTSEMPDQLYALSNGQVLWVKGTDYKLMNPDTLALTPISKTPVAFGDFVSVIPLSKGRILFLGGTEEGKIGGDKYAQANRAFLYDIKSKTWTKLPNMQEYRLSPAAGELPDGRIFVAGGGTLSGSTLEVLDLNTKTWTSFPTNLPEPNGVNVGTIEVLPAGSSKVVIHSNLRLYVFDMTSQELKEYATPGHNGIFLFTRLRDGHFMMLGDDQAYTFDVNTGTFTPIRHPQTYIELYSNALYAMPDGGAIYLDSSADSKTKEGTIRIYKFKPE